MRPSYIPDNEEDGELEAEDEEIDEWEPCDPDE